MAAIPVGRRRSGRRLLVAGVVIMLVALGVLLVLRTTGRRQRPARHGPWHADGCDGDERSVGRTRRPDDTDSDRGAAARLCPGVSDGAHR
jgi:hypothetical protein